MFVQVILTVSNHKMGKRVHNNTSLLLSQLNHLLLLVVGLYLYTLIIFLSLHFVYNNMPHVGEHSSLQIHADGVDSSSDYHLPQTNQEQTSHSSKYGGKHNRELGAQWSGIFFMTRLQDHEKPRKKPLREKTTFTDSTPLSTGRYYLAVTILLLCEFLYLFPW